MGKSSIVYVMGLSCLIAISLRNISDSSTSSMDAYTNYYARTMAHNVVAAGANVAVGRFLRDTSTAGGAFSIGGGDVTYGFQNVGDTLVVMTAMSHLNVETGIGADKGAKRDTIVVAMKHPPFSMYGWFTDQEVNGYRDSSGALSPFSGQADWKITGDSVWGPAHTNGHFNLAGTPYFHDRVTAGSAPTITKFKPTDKPVFDNGNQWGIKVDRPKSNIDNLQSVAASDGLLFQDQDVGLTFNSDGTVHIKIPPSTGAIRDTTAALASIVKNPTNGIVIGVKNGDLRIKGTYSGNITLGAFSNSSGKKGNVWIDGNGIVAANDPSTNPNSNDMLGIVADRFVYISKDGSRNSSSVVNIQASIYSQNGELTAEDFWKGGLQGTVKLFGGVIQKTAGSLGTFDSGGIKTGFFYNIKFDERFRSRSTFAFPKRAWIIATWWEN